MRITKLAVLLNLLCLFFFITDVFAASQTFNAFFFKPATGRNPYTILHGTTTLHQWQFEVGDYFSYGYRPLEMKEGNRRLQGVIDHSLVSDFVAAVGFLDWLQFGLDFPTVIVNEFRPPLVSSTIPMKNKASLGDLRFELKFKVLDQCAFPVGLAFIPFMSLPTGKDEYYAGDPSITGGFKLAVDGRVIKRLGLTLNIGYQGGKSIAIQNIDYKHIFILGGGINAILPHGISIFGEADAEAAFSHFMSDRDMNPVELIAGVKWDIKDTGVRVSAAAGSCVICGVKGAYARSMLGVSYRWNPKKYQDKDKELEKPCERRFSKAMTAEEIYYLKMHCPPNPADYKQGVHDEACPKYYELSELAELIMRCPPRPEDFKLGIHDDACPKVYTLKEKYSPDEIWSIYTLMAAEYQTRCPSDPEEFNPLLHDQACPKYYDLKEISELSLKCPPDPAQFKQGIHDDACPKYYSLREQYPKEQWEMIVRLSKLDTDKDKINDYLDLCPRKAEDYNGFADDDGCPDLGVAAVSGGEIKTFKPVYFDFNKWDLKYDALQALDQVISLINETPWIRRVLVQGHADARGTEAANQKISMKRADTVIQYMLLHGIRSNVVLTPIGYGAQKPVSLGTTEEDYAKNRRVVFTIASHGYIPPKKAIIRPKAKIEKEPLEKKDQTKKAPKRWE